MASKTVDPKSVQRGCLPLGTKLEGFGTIVQTSLTAYLVEWVEPCQYGHQRSSAWLSFDQVHGRPAAASPLVVFS